jgi:hypothetical protein
MWLDGADPAGTGVAPAGNSTLTTWVDKSGSGNNASGGVSPTWNSNAVQFDGTKYLSTPCPAGTNTAAYFFVWSQTTVSGSQQSILGGNALGTAALITLPSQPVFGDWNSAIIEVPSVIAAGSTYLASAGAGGGTVSYGLNGSTMYSASHTFSGTGTFTVGAGYIDNRSKLFGSINEILVYNITLNTTQRQTVEGYLAWKWGVQASLPAGHPFKTAAPT